ncbi:vegetative cell wall protein gp1 [Carica papaya]|uniref:vegetative cell wall protein gp1 n=1 Tax=Carica papaya TaxID=3649 RepID=UPI000B8CB063|nr:vegetative cell wall protein gp1 [Carica papaya]
MAIRQFCVLALIGLLIAGTFAADSPAPSPSSSRKITPSSPKVSPTTAPAPKSSSPSTSPAPESSTPSESPSEEPVVSEGPSPAEGPVSDSPPAPPSDFFAPGPETEVGFGDMVPVPTPSDGFSTKVSVLGVAALAAVVELFLF